MNKIQALKKTVHDLKAGLTEYNWFDSDHCNCGVVAKTLLGGELPKDNGALGSPVCSNIGVFSARAYCITTNLPLPRVYQALKDVGFTYQELLELEYLSNEEVLKMIGVKPIYLPALGYSVYPECGHRFKENLIAYLEAWITLLERKHQYTDITKQLAVLPAEETADVGIYEAIH